MMKKIFTICLFILSCLLNFNCVSTGSDTILQKAQFTSPTKLLLHEYYKAKENANSRGEIILPERVVNDYSLTKKDGKYFAGALITISESINENDLLNLNLVVNSKSGNVWSISLPLDSIEELAKKDGIELIDISLKPFNR